MRTKYLWLFLAWIGCGPAWGQGYIPTPGFPVIPTATPQPDDCGLIGKIYRASDTGDLRTISKIAAKHKKDPGLFTTCQLFLYLGKKIGAGEFIRAFPARAKEFWEFADGSGPCDDVPLPGVFDGQGGPIFVYYGQLISLMEKGNRQAAKKVLDTFEFADGETAEGIFPEIGEFCAGYPDRVLSNWDLYRGHQDGLSRCLGFPSRDELEGMRERVSGLKGDPGAKAELLDLIDGILKNN